MRRLVQSEDANFTDIEAIRELRIEAEAIEASHGQNPYSNYLRKYGKRPNRVEAEFIGRALGGRVRADDGTLQPKPIAKYVSKQSRHSCSNGTAI